MKKLIKASADLTHRSVDQVNSYCKKYIQNIANECFESPVPEVIERFVGKQHFEISDGSDVSAPLYSYVINLESFSTIVIYVKSLYDDDEFLGFICGEVQTVLANGSKFSSNKFGNDEFYKWWVRSSNHRYKLLDVTKDQIQDKFGNYDSVEDLLPRSELLKIFKQFEQGLQSSKQTKSEHTSITWRSLVKHLTSEDYDADEQDEYTEFLDSVCMSVEEKMGLFVEPSVQGSQGGVWIYDNDTNDTLVEDYDYETFNEEITDLAINSSSKKEFITKYKDYLIGLTE